MANAFQPKVVRKEDKEQQRLEHYVPTLFIGLGGTSKDVLMRLRKRFYDQYASKNPAFARYLIIDTDTERWWPGGEAAEEDYLPVRPKVGEHVDCQIKEQQFYNTFDVLERQNDERFVGWLKPEMRNYGARAVIKGAGTHRQFGRMAFSLNYRDIRKQTEDHIKGVLTDAAQVGADGIDGTVQQDTLEVVIVTSLAGGTGAGMFIDMAYLVKDIFNSDHRLMSLRSKYTTVIGVLPSPFEPHVNDTTYRKFQQNAYATLMELEHYGSPLSGDELFVGQAIDPASNRNRVGFVAPWKMGDQFIEGAGWEACYLIDNVTPLALQTPLKLSETYQMIADYLFLDFQRSEFAIQKRSNRCNLSQYQEDHIEMRVRKPGGESAVRSMHKGSDIVYAAQNGCTFSSFGLAELSFNRDRVYRAASYRLAHHLLAQRWLGSEGDLQNGQYANLSKRLIYDPEPNAQQPSPPSFRVERLVSTLYNGAQGNRLAVAKRDFDEVRKRHYTRGSAELRKLLDTHEALLNGPVGQLVADREKQLNGNSDVLGTLRERIRYSAREQADAHGIAVATRLLAYFRDIFDIVTEMANEIQDPGVAADTTARLEEADTVMLPGRKLAQRIEFPRACDQAKSYVIARYHQTAAPYVQKFAVAMKNYIGADKEQQPPELEKHGTLYAYLEEGGTQLRRIAERLDVRFNESRKEEGNDRTQSLFPSSWNPAKYDDQINRALVSYSEVGAAGGTQQFDWERFNDRVFEELRTDRPREMGDVRTLTGLIDQWFGSHKKADKDIVNIAETLAKACRRVLYKAGLNLSAFFEGSVVDLLMINYTEAERKHKLERFLRSSAPYCPLDMQTQASMTGGFRPIFDNLLGKKAGDIDNTSLANERDLIEELDDLSQGLGGDIDGEINSKLDGSRSELVLCREVWGLPLQYYSPLKTLHEVYMQAGRSVDECHINHNESWEDLPDVRAIAPEVYEQIRDNVENVLFAMVKGTITCRQDGAYVVKVPDPFAGTDTFRVGSRISRIIKKACEEEPIRLHLQSDRAAWENSAGPKEWAILFASAMLTYEFSKREIKKDSDKHSSPLRNCFRMLLERTQRRLVKSTDGERYYEHLRAREDTDGRQAADHYKAVYLDLLKRGILFRASEQVPIYEVNWDKLDSFQIAKPSDPVTTGEETST